MQNGESRRRKMEIEIAYFSDINRPKSSKINREARIHPRGICYYTLHKLATSASTKIAPKHFLGVRVSIPFAMLDENGGRVSSVEYTRIRRVPKGFRINDRYCGQSRYYYYRA